MSTALNPFTLPAAKAAPRKKPAKPAVKPPAVRRGDARTERFIAAVMGIKFK